MCLQNRPKPPRGGPHEPLGTSPSARPAQAKRRLRQARDIAWRAWQCSWGAPQTLLGLAVRLRQGDVPLGCYRGEVVVYWHRPAGMSLGLFLFLPEAERAGVEAGTITFLLKHEYGHAVQSALLGPLYLPVVGLPSLAWSNVPALRRWRGETGFDYYGFPIERAASFLGGVRRK